MIAELRGNIVRVGKGFVVVDVSGVGYAVRSNENTIAKIADKENVRLYTHLAVREDALELFGFLEEKELMLFELLLGISGIGPRLATGILSLADADTLAAAIASGNTSYLTKVSGVGRKNAEKIVLELKEKLGGFGGSIHKGDEEVLEALQSLGYSARETREALKAVSREVSNTDDRLREALKLLGKK